MNCGYCNIEIKEGDWVWTVFVGDRFKFQYFCLQGHIHQKFGDIETVGEVIDDK